MLIDEATSKIGSNGSKGSRFQGHRSAAVPGVLEQLNPSERCLWNPGAPLVPLEPLDPSRILLIRLRLIGDVVFTTPAIGALRRRFPSAAISYLVEAPAEPVVRHHPDLDDVIIVERPRGLERWRYDLQLARRLRARRFDLVIDFHAVPAVVSSPGPRARRSASATTFRTAVVLHDALPWTRSLVPRATPCSSSAARTARIERGTARAIL